VRDIAQRPVDHRGVRGHARRDRVCQTGWTRPHLLGLLAAAGVTPRSALRTTKSPSEDLGLLDLAVPDDALLDAMLAHPILVGGAWASTARHWTGLAVPRAGRQSRTGLDHGNLAGNLKSDP